MHEALLDERPRAGRDAHGLELGLRGDVAAQKVQPPGRHIHRHRVRCRRQLRWAHSDLHARQGGAGCAADHGAAAGGRLEHRHTVGAAEDVNLAIEDKRGRQLVHARLQQQAGARGGRRDSRCHVLPRRHARCVASAARRLGWATRRGAPFGLLHVLLVQKDGVSLLGHVVWLAAAPGQHARSEIAADGAALDGRLGAGRDLQPRPVLVVDEPAV